MSTRSCVSGPAISTTSFTGAPVATSARISPTSPGAIGWTSSGAIVAAPSCSAQPATMAAKSWNCVARTIVNGTEPSRTNRSCVRLPS